MAKILSFGVSDELYQRIVTAQQRYNCPYLSPFLRLLVDNALTVLEQTPVTEEKKNG